MAAGKGKKEKVFHPNSRKAAQVERSQLRKAKMEAAAEKRVKRASGSSKHSSPLHSFLYAPLIILLVLIHIYNTI